MTFISGVDSHTLSPGRTGAVTVGLWVVLDEQFADAKALLSNPDHKPATALSVDEMAALEAGVNENQPIWRRKSIERAAAGLIGLALAGLLSYVVYSVLRSA